MKKKLGVCWSTLNKMARYLLPLVIGNAKKTLVDWIDVEKHFDDIRNGAQDLEVQVILSRKTYEGIAKNVGVDKRPTTTV